VSRPNNFCWGVVFLYMNPFIVISYSKQELLLGNHKSSTSPPLTGFGMEACRIGHHAVHVQNAGRNFFRIYFHPRCIMTIIMPFQYRRKTELGSMGAMDKCSSGSPLSPESVFSERTFCRERFGPHGTEHCRPRWHSGRRIAPVQASWLRLRNKAESSGFGLAFFLKEA
jgi:hypothetical protein